MYMCMYAGRCYVTGFNILWVPELLHINEEYDEGVW